MIYQENNSFLVFSYKASYGDTETYINDQVAFESELLRQLQNEENMASIKESRDASVISLPTITYEEIALTADEQKRFDVIKEVPGMTLDDVRNYTADGTKSNNQAFKIIELNEYVTNLELALVDVYETMLLME